jgi:hypothetical protein
MVRSEVVVIVCYESIDKENLCLFRSGVQTLISEHKAGLDSHPDLDKWYSSQRCNLISVRSIVMSLFRVRSYFILAQFKKFLY